MARVIVTGLIAQHRNMGGVAWDYLNFLIGLRSLGHDVFYVEDSGEWPYLDEGPSDGDWIAWDPSEHVQYLARVMEAFDLQERWSYFFPIRERWYGMSDLKRREVIETSDVVLNVSGTLDYPEKYNARATLVYIDTDPVFTQIAAKLGARSLE